jgi:hypothetical protein
MSVFRRMRFLKRLMKNKYKRKRKLSKNLRSRKT